ncbi:MAG: hypothetical protein ACI95C_002247, partial [Pseudohongiellaceae bacterium]
RPEGPHWAGGAVLFRPLAPLRGALNRSEALKSGLLPSIGASRDCRSNTPPPPQRSQFLVNVFVIRYLATLLIELRSVEATDIVVKYYVSRDAGS